MNDACLDDGERPCTPHCLGQPFQPVTYHEEHIPDTAVLQVGEHAHPEPGALAAGAGPQAQHVLAAVRGDADGGVDGPVGHLAVADLDHDGVDEDGRIHRIQRPGGPLLHLGDDFLSDPGYGFP